MRNCLAGSRRQYQSERVAQQLQVLSFVLSTIEQHPWLQPCGAAGSLQPSRMVVVLLPVWKYHQPFVMNKLNPA